MSHSDVSQTGPPSACAFICWLCHDLGAIMMYLVGCVSLGFGRADSATAFFAAAIYLVIKADSIKRTWKE